MLLTQADLEQAGEWARHSGMDPRRVFVTGAIQVEHLDLGQVEPDRVEP